MPQGIFFSLYFSRYAQRLLRVILTTVLCRNRSAQHVGCAKEQTISRLCPRLRRMWRRACRRLMVRLRIGEFNIEKERIVRGKYPDGALPLFIGGTDARSKDRG